MMTGFRNWQLALYMMSMDEMLHATSIDLFTEREKQSQCISA